jgi:hypothetical protein
MWGKRKRDVVIGLPVENVDQSNQAEDGSCIGALESDSLIGECQRFFSQEPWILREGSRLYLPIRGIKKVTDGPLEYVRIH